MSVEAQLLEAGITAGNYFLHLVIVLIPLFLGVTFVAGLIRQYVSDERIRAALMGRGTTVGYLLASGFGALTPFCSCSAVPVVLGMLEAQIPLGIVMTFAITSPMVNEVAVALLLAGFGAQGPEIATLYVAMGMTAALIAGLVISRLRLDDQIRKVVMRRTDACDCEEGEAGTDGSTRWQRFKPKGVEAARYSWHFFYTLSPYIFAGMAIGAFLHGYIPEELILAVAGPGSWWAVPIAAIIGIPMYANMAVMLPIALALFTKGMSIGAVMALVLGAVGTSIPELILLSRVFKPKLIGTFVVAMFLIATTMGYAFNLIL